MKNVKMRVPEGREKEAHDYMRSLGYEYCTVGKFIDDATHLFGDSSGGMTMINDGDKDFFQEVKAEEIFLPGFGPEYDDLTIEDYFEKRIREMAKNPKNGLNIWHLHFILDRLDKERNK